jgi:hypothetical protein
MRLNQPFAPPPTISSSLLSVPQFCYIFFAEEMNGDGGSADAGEKTIMNGRAC